MGVAGHNDSAERQSVIEVEEKSRFICCSRMGGPSFFKGEMFRVSLLGMDTEPFLTGARAAKLYLGVEERDTIRLPLGPSWFSPRVPSDVVGLVSAILLPLSFASDDFGRARFDVGWIAGGRIPLPTLAENVDAVVEADVLLGKFELLRYD